MTPITKRIESFLNYLLLFLLPTQIAFHFWPNFAFVFGIRVDYLSPSIYLTDLLFLLIFVFWLKTHWKDFLVFVKANTIYILVFLLLAAVNSVFSVSALPTVIKWIKLFELGLFYVYVRLRPEIFRSEKVLKTLFASAIIFSLIGIGQFVFGRTFGGPLYLLGERSFNLSTPGIALISINGQAFLRAYSTFSHPNSFAGFIGVVLTILMGKYSRKITRFKLIGFLIVGLAFILAFSLSAITGLIITGFVYILLKAKRIKDNILFILLPIFFLVSLILPFTAGYLLSNHFFNREDINQRLELSLGAAKSISQHFITGTGLNTFSITESKIENLGFRLWSFQPVHNIYLLVFSETGIIGLIIFFLLIFRFIGKGLNKRNVGFLLPLVFILTTGLFDHYSLTLQQNLFLFVFVLAQE